MDKDLNQARLLLEQGGYTCVLCRGEITRCCTLRGVRPLLELLDEGGFQGFSAADKVLGKAGAFLYVLLGVRAVYAPVMSRDALRILGRSGIDARFDLEVPRIFNRSRTGLCPMETATASIEDPLEALAAIRETAARLGQAP